LADEELLGLAEVWGGYSLPLVSGSVGAGGTGGTFGIYSGPLTPHPARDIRRLKQRVLLRIAIMNVSKTND